MMKKIVLSLMLLCVALGVAAQSRPEAGAEGQEGQRFDLPEFTLQSETYGNVSTAELKGKVVLVCLFATWCGPCQLELAEVQARLWPKYKNRDDFELLVIGREHTEAQLRTYNEKKRFTFPLYPDPDRTVFALFAENSIPRSYLFDREGKCIHASLGYTAQEFDQLMEALEGALK